MVMARARLSLVHPVVPINIESPTPQDKKGPRSPRGPPIVGLRLYNGSLAAKGIIARVLYLNRYQLT
jgi:hypothetical protein